MNKVDVAPVTSKGMDRGILRLMAGAHVVCNLWNQFQEIGPIERKTGQDRLRAMTAREDRYLLIIETRFSLQSDCRRTLIWRAPGTRYRQENPIERHRYGGAGWLALGEELFLVPELTCLFRV
ncbi:HTH_Tnp_Tc3_2 domain-containing protein [Trichonephila clavipes]|nr:HTH_Tnp_Tc3_2 domain-containing protein [Trichonephila clavipes]